MKKLLALLFVTFFLCANGFAYIGDELAEDLRQLVRLSEHQEEMTREERGAAARGMNYVYGAYEMLAFIQFMDKKNAVTDMPQGLERVLIALTVQKWMKEHPKRWNEQAVVLVHSCLRETYPPKP